LVGALTAYGSFGVISGAAFSQNGTTNASVEPGGGDASRHLANPDAGL
jgi:hypothetical protein